MRPTPVPSAVIRIGESRSIDPCTIASLNKTPSSTRRINERFELGVRYWYEPYKQDDFSFNVLAPYVHGSLTSETPKYLFQDARYGSYNSNIASVFVRFRF